MDALLERHAFTAACFRRDRDLCVTCRAPAVDAHHILERKLFGDGGYYLSNAASLCADCHMRAEMTLLSVEEIRAAIGITEPALPPGFDPARVFDKWGNEVLPDGTRRPGPLFEDDGCRKALSRAHLLWSGIFLSPDQT